MLIRCLLSFIIFIFICIPAMIISWPVIALLLLTSWDGRTTIFGNAKWGRGNDHFAYPTKGWWQEFNWLALRNPVNNLSCLTLGIRQKTYVLTGDAGITDERKSGLYKIRMGWAWEYYWVKLYTIFGNKRCARARIGWKIKDNAEPLAAYVFTINPWQKA